MKKSKKRRSDVKYPGLNPSYNSKIKQEYLDYDYVSKLSDKDKEFLNKFTEEFYGAALDVHNLENNLHNTPKLKKDCQDRNNARNRCIYSIQRATNRLISATYTEINSSVKSDLDEDIDIIKV